MSTDANRKMIHNKQKLQEMTTSICANNTYCFIGGCNVGVVRFENYNLFINNSRVLVHGTYYVTTVVDILKYGYVVIDIYEFYVYRSLSNYVVTFIPWLK